MPAAQTPPTYKGRKALITGGLGFVGSNLAHRLVTSGASVTTLDNEHPDFGANRFNLNGIEKTVQVIHGDIRDAESCRNAVKGQDIVFHLAAQVSHIDSMKEPFFDIDVNARGTATLLESCRHHAPGVRFIYGGTRGQYGKLLKVPVDETHALFPLDVYGANKTVGELYTLVYTNAGWVAGSSVRMNNTYGPRHQMKHAKYGILNWFIRLAFDGQTIKIFGEGKQLRDYNHIDDTVDALVRAGITPEAVGQVYNLGSGAAIEFREMTKQVVAACGSGAYEFVPWPEDRKRIEVGDFAADFSKAQKELGWNPVVKFDVGLRSTVEFYLRFRSHYW